MQIKDLVARQGKVDLTAEVVEKAEPRSFNKMGSSGRVANAKIKDATGVVTLTLWNDDIDKVNVGDKVMITNGYVGEWKDELQLSTGKFGKLEVVEKKDGEDLETDIKESDDAPKKKGHKDPAKALGEEKDLEDDYKDKFSDEEDEFEEEDVEDEEENGF